MGINLIHGACVTVMVASVERALRFYTRALGLTLRCQRGPDYAEVEAPGLTLALLASERSTHHDRPLPVHCSIGFDVEQLEGAMLVLRERGVEFAPEIAEGERERIAYFADEDGTPLHLRQRKE
jgi:catechol 2,3-dioxygenase-like lactoylglutathione lyase family enzyme